MIFLDTYCRLFSSINTKCGCMCWKFYFYLHTILLYIHREGVGGIRRRAGLSTEILLFLSFLVTAHIYSIQKCVLRMEMSFLKVLYRFHLYPIYRGCTLIFQSGKSLIILIWDFDVASQRQNPQSELQQFFKPQCLSLTRFPTLLSQLAKNNIKRS